MCFIIWCDSSEAANITATAAVDDAMAFDVPRLECAASGGRIDDYVCNGSSRSLPSNAYKWTASTAMCELDVTLWHIIVVIVMVEALSYSQRLAKDTDLF